MHKVAKMVTDAVSARSPWRQN